MKSVEFKTIKIANFLSVGEEIVEIPFKKGLHVLTGINRDKPERRNAIGKSTIADALYFAIFGETLRPIKKDLITNYLTGGGTCVELHFDVIVNDNVDSYRIVRTLDPSRVYLYKNGEDITRDTIQNTNKYICTVLNASPSVFQNCVIMTVNNAIPFMAKSKVDKRKFIEDIFGMEAFSLMLSNIRNEFNDIKKSYDICLSSNAEMLRGLSSLKDQRIVMLKSRKDRLNKYEGRKAENEKELDALEQKVKDGDVADKTPLLEDIAECKRQIITDDTQIQQLLTVISEKKTTAKHKKTQYNTIGTDEETCPICLRTMTEHDCDAVAEGKLIIKNEMILLVEDIKELNEDLNSANKSKKSSQQRVDDIRDEIDHVERQINEEANNKARIEQLNKWKSELAEDMVTAASKTTEFDTLIIESVKRLKVSNKELESHKKNIDKLNVIKYVVSEEGVKSYIVNKLLSLLNNTLLHYLRELDSNSICMFNEYFEEEILNEKNKVCSYFNFSGAERKAIDLACLFTFADIRRLQGNVKYNLTIYDELFDSSFDEKGIEIVTGILDKRVEELDECSIVISHRKESIKAVTGDIIFLEKENGITRRVDYNEGESI